MQSYVSPDGTPRPSRLWLGATRRIRWLALTQPGDPAQDGLPQATLLTWNKRQMGQPQQSRVSVGRPDPGAGQVYRSLRVLDGPRKGQSGYLHTSNIEDVQDPAYRMTKTGEFKLGDEVYKCRYVKDAAFIGVTSKRTVIIWDNGKTATYATRNFDGTPGVFVAGGKVQYDELGPEYIFPANSEVSYLVHYHEYSAFLGVVRGGHIRSTELFLAYSFSIPKK
ncbi:hypothetical protein ACFP81_13295 [Deinococcus lacus]|uniref:Uncharacterized protein n=1 Tax=Deinococcus lacus TaxID=392561 RepID=A0ABW1YE54_9DEIO